MSGVKGQSGRPKGLKKTGKIQVMIKPEVKEEFSRITESNGSCPSAVIHEFIYKYIRENNERGGKVRGE